MNFKNRYEGQATFTFEQAREVICEAYKNPGPYGNKYEGLTWIAHHNLNALTQIKHKTTPITSAIDRILVGCLDVETRNIKGFSEDSKFNCQAYRKNVRQNRLSRII